MKRNIGLLLCTLMAASLTGCVVEEHGPSHPPPPHNYWVPGHYGPNGGWHEGHWE
jgi:hypothetical protein